MLKDERLGLPKWRNANTEEILALQKLGTLNVVDKVLDGNTICSTKPVYKNKPPANGEPGSKIALVRS